MLIEVTVAYVPYIGERGTRRELPDGQARALILLKKARAVIDDGVRSTRRVYQRRDMTAETEAQPAAPARALRARRRRRDTAEDAE